MIEIEKINNQMLKSKYKKNLPDMNKLCYACKHLIVLKMLKIRN